MRLSPYQILRIKEQLQKKDLQNIVKTLPQYEITDLAAFTASLDKGQNVLFLEGLLKAGVASSVLAEMPEPALKELLTHANPRLLSELFQAGSPDDLVYFLEFFNEEKSKELLDSLPLGKKIRVQQFLDYPDNTAGRVMQSPVFSVPEHFAVGRSIELLRQRAKEEPIYYIYCVNVQNQLSGVVSMRQIAVADENLRLKSLINKAIISVNTHTDLTSAARTVSHYNFLAIPVVNSKKELMGLITKDEVIDIIQEQATADLYARAGLEEDDRIFTPAWTSIKYRLPWIGLNLFLAALASSVVSVFENTMSHLIILASLKNIVTGIGGNTAIQTLTIVTRGLAVGDFRFISIGKALRKELIVGSAMGLSAGLGAFIITYVWKGSLLVSTVILIAMFLNSLIAVLAGACIPAFLQRLKRDPAVGSGVLATTVTDIFGFFSFLGIAWLGLKLAGESF